MKLTYKSIPYTLEDDVLDVGYGSEKVEVTTKDDKKVLIGGHQNRIQIIVSAPAADAALHAEVEALVSGMNEVAAGRIDGYVITAKGGDSWPGGFFTHVVDSDEGFGDYYGLRIGSGELSGELTKCLSIVAEDGTLMYHDLPEAIEAPFNTERFVRNINLSMSCCDKKGCH